MRIVADENIPFVREAFGALGEVHCVPGRAIEPQMLRDAEILLTRSITRVDAALLADSAVRFVATATIGTDHIDLDYLRKADIAFSSAPGCNANSVGEYICAALLELAETLGLDLPALRLGIVGVGNVGTRVHEKASALGMQCVLHDPPLADASGDPRYRPLDEILACDVITFHVPLERGGAYPTWHLVDAAFLAKLAPETILINTARGAVIDNAALDSALQRQAIRAAVLDVWEGEPNPDTALMARTAIASPHIAGYSFDGKVNGTRQIYEAACAFLGREAAWDPAPLMPAPEAAEIALGNEANPLIRCVRSAYDIMLDDRGMRALAAMPAAAQGAQFDALRKGYRCRREFPSIHINLSGEAAAHETTLRGLGFRCTLS